ncbi:MAG: ATP-binding protein [Dehalococcoidia bacterium]|nr:ATP-binding protein [Dehalococcoidia bacterium]
MIERLTPNQVRRPFDPTTLDFKTTVEVEPLIGIVGQDRALQALGFGLDIQRTGFNVFVSGPPGTGKTHAVQSILHLRAEQLPRANDWCYVNNFQDSYRPKSIQLPPGRGRALQRAMDTLVQQARQDIPKAFESEEYTNRREYIGQGVQAAQQELLEQLNRKSLPLGLTVRISDMGVVVVPVVNGNPISAQQFQTLDQPTQERLELARQSIEGDIKDLTVKLRAVQRQAEERLTTLNREATLFVIGGLFEDLRKQFSDCKEALPFLEAAESDMIANLQQFLTPPQAPTPQAAVVLQELAFRKYAVNVLVDNSDVQGAPVVIENNPTYPNLFGRLDREAVFGVLQADFTLFHAGSMHRANGGYLVIPVDELLRNPGSYEGLKRALRNYCLTIEDMADRAGITSAKSVQGESVALNVKVVLLGSAYAYQALYGGDEDFREAFKVRADFDSQMERNHKNIDAYAGWISAQCQKEGLRPLDASAVGKIIELGSRLAEDQERLTTRFGDLANTLREASHWAIQQDSPHVSASHINHAISARDYRANLIEERLRELVARNVIKVDTEGVQVGQVNALAASSLGDYIFGMPSRITASVSPGQTGLVDIEREATLGGATHTKGVLILGGYLMWRYAQKHPLSLSARLVFEQTYDRVDGDSASSTELYAIISAISNVPIKQGIAVTGSVDQRGNVQAIGAVNHKIEGFFDVCRIKGLTGGQGVMIPKTNMQNLMLREDVVDAIAKGKFHIWTVATVDEGIEVLTGVPADGSGKNGRVPGGAMSERVQKRLEEFAFVLRGTTTPAGRRAPVTRTTRANGAHEPAPTKRARKR